jgi:hypothetical protein
MLLTDVGGRVPFTRADPFFQTTPDSIDADVEAFADKLGGLAVSFVPVKPVDGAETGFCHRNVAECVALYGGHSVYGHAFWRNRLFLMAEVHSVWLTPRGDLIDPTPTAEGETQVCFALDPSLSGAAFDGMRPPPNRAMNITDKADSSEVAREIAALSPARLDYEKRRAGRAGLDLETHLAKKIGRTELSAAVDDFIAASEARDQLATPTSTRFLTHDPQAFRSAQLKVCQVEDRIRRLLAARDGETSETAEGGPLADVAAAPDGGTMGASSFDGLIAALLDPSFDMVAFDLASTGPKVLYAGNLERGAHSYAGSDRSADEQVEKIAQLVKSGLGKESEEDATAAAKWPR